MHSLGKKLNRIGGAGAGEGGFKAELDEAVVFHGVQLGENGAFFHCINVFSVFFCIIKKILVKSIDFIFLIRFF